MWVGGVGWVGGWVGWLHCCCYIHATSHALTPPHACPHALCNIRARTHPHPRFVLIVAVAMNSIVAEPSPENYLWYPETKLSTEKHNTHTHTLTYTYTHAHTYTRARTRAHSPTLQHTHIIPVLSIANTALTQTLPRSQVGDGDHGASSRACCGGFE